MKYWIIIDVETDRVIDKVISRNTPFVKHGLPCLVSKNEYDKLEIGDLY